MTRTDSEPDEGTNFTLTDKEWQNELEEFIGPKVSVIRREGSGWGTADYSKLAANPTRSRKD